MIELPKILTLEEFQEILNDAVSPSGLSVSVNVVRVSILPVVQEQDGARKLGSGGRGTWAILKDSAIEWREYVSKRAALIEKGIWSPKRPYSTRDMREIQDGRFDEIMDGHPAFGEQSWGENWE